MKFINWEGNGNFKVGLMFTNTYYSRSVTNTSSNKTASHVSILCKRVPHIFGSAISDDLFSYIGLHRSVRHIYI